MRHRVMAAAAAASVLVIGTALPSAATGDQPPQTGGSSTQPAGPGGPTDWQGQPRDICKEFLQSETLLAGGEDSAENDIAKGTVHHDGKKLDVELKDHKYKIESVGLRGETTYAVYNEKPYKDLTVAGESGEKEKIKYWVVCGEKKQPRPEPTHTTPTEEPTAKPTATEKPTEEPTKKPTEEPTKKPAPVPTEVPAGSTGSTSGDTPWLLFGFAAAGAMAAAGAGAVLGRRRNGSEV
jgi:hypothetical protein